MRGRRGAAARAGGFDQRWLALSVTTIGSFMSILDSTIVNIALPSVLKDFHARLEDGQLVLTIYLLALAVVIPLSGFLAERVGLKRMYMITLACFTLGSALCGSAWNLDSLVGFRALQGLGGGMLQPLGMAMVFTLITPIERGYFMGLLGLPMLLGPILGPTLGGYLVQYSSWRFIFYINLPIGLINLGLAWWLLKEQPRRADARLDARGFALSLLAFPCVLLGLSEGEQQGWTSPLVLGLLGGGAVALGAFIVAELRHRQPLLQLKLFAHPIFSLAMAINFVTQFSLFGMGYILPLLFQEGHGLGAAATGLAMFPSGIVSFIAMNGGGRLYNRVGPRRLAIPGMVVLLVTTGLFSRTTAATSIPILVTLASLRGLAMGLCMMPIQTAAYNTVPQHELTRATALTNVLFRIFGAASTAILTTVLVASLSWHGAAPGVSITSGTAPLPLLAQAFDDAFLAMAVLTVVGLALCWFLKDPVLEALKVSPAGAREERALALEGAE
ncbi:MAG TPA: MDR family MFS transporter [Thermomicrobiales bacterium]|nr:MDR family MFS transporter [Thermomicrobiales bacterium]